MKILFLCHRFPFPPRGGAKVRAFHAIKHLQAQGHDVTVASLYRSDEEESEGAGLSEYCHKIIGEQVSPLMAKMRMGRNLLTSTPSSMGYFYSPRLQRRVREELETYAYDLVFCHCSSVAPYVAGFKGARKILDFCDMDSQKWLAYAGVHAFPKSLGYWLEGKKLERAEAQLARQFETCTTATPAETETLESFDTGTRAAWFPNGVDLDYFSPTTEPYDKETISFIGRMDYYPNAQCMVDFCEQTLPLIKERRPDTKLIIVGAEPLPMVERLAKIEGVTVTGSVPDVRPYVRKSAATVAPLTIARGTQNKILESLAMGVPCVSSTLAAGGVDCEVEEHFLAASKPEEYARQLLRLLEDPRERRRFSEAGRARMESHHSWEAAMRKLDSILDQTLAVAVA